MAAIPSVAFTQAQEATAYIQSCIQGTSVPNPEIAIICGSGLGGLISTFHADPQVVIPYTSIPHFPVSTVAGHLSQLVFGTMGEQRKAIVAMVGRVHFYEGYDPAQITLPIRVFALLGIKTLIGKYNEIFS
jgi:purine-nucleoside phosphorylase